MRFIVRCRYKEAADEYKYNADAFAARKTSEAKQETAGTELPKVREDKAR